VGSIPTAPTNISFSNSRLQISEGAQGSIKLTLPALAVPDEPLCCLPLSKRREPQIPNSPTETTWIFFSSFKPGYELVYDDLEGAFSCLRLIGLNAPRSRAYQER